VISNYFLSVMIFIPNIMLVGPLMSKYKCQCTDFEHVWNRCTDRQTNYRGADNSLARPIYRCILFDGENISFDANLVILVNSTNIPPISIVNRIYDTQNLLFRCSSFIPGRVKDLSAPRYVVCY
jgi:hypothetical protein